MSSLRETDGAHAVDCADTKPHRPPPNAPTIRPTAQAPKLQDRSEQQALLEKTARTIMLGTQEDGSVVFDVEIHDALFDNLRCTISSKDGETSARFRVADDNLRRLLEAESGRLAAGLEARGLRVTDILVSQDRP